MADDRHPLPRKGPWIALASVLAIVLLHQLVWPRVVRSRARGSAGEALSELLHCLAGPGADVGDAMLRRRAISASLAGASQWPDQCHVAAAKLEVALTTMGQTERSCDGACCAADASCTRLAELRASLAAVRLAMTHRHFAGNTAAALFASAQDVPLPIVEASGKEPPTPHEVPNLVGSAPLFSGHFERLLSDPAEGRVLRLLFHERPKRAVHCTLDETARCTPLPASIPIAGDLGLPGHAPGAPAQILAKSGESWAMHPLGGGGALALGEGEVAAAFVWADGRRAAAIGGHVIVSDGRTQPLPLLHDMLLTGGWLMGSEDTVHGAHLTARRIDAERLSEPVALSDVDGAPALYGCTMGGEAALLAHMAPQHGRLAVAKRLLAFHGPDGWTSTSPLEPIEPNAITCERGVVIATQIDVEDERVLAPAIGDPSKPAVAGAYRITRTRCTAAGCNKETGRLLLERRRDQRHLVASLGPAILAVWESPLGDMRMRLAPPSDLERAPMRVLLDDAEHGGAQLGRVPEALWVRDGVAYLLVGRGPDHAQEIFALRIDEAGSVGVLSP